MLWNQLTPLSSEPWWLSPSLIIGSRLFLLSLSGLWMWIINALYLMLQDFITDLCAISLQCHFFWLTWLVFAAVFGLNISHVHVAGIFRAVGSRSISECWGLLGGECTPFFCGFAQRKNCVQQWRLPPSDCSCWYRDFKATTWESVWWLWWGEIWKSCWVWKPSDFLGGWATAQVSSLFNLPEDGVSLGKISKNQSKC